MTEPSSSAGADAAMPTLLRILVLGGSSEATMLAAALARRTDVSATLSLAGRTTMPAMPIATRVGGFGGSKGLAAYIRANAIEIVIDATHPFAAQISLNAREAARLTGCRLIEIARPTWEPEPGDSWTEVATMAAAAAALGPVPRRVFLTVGRLQLAAFATEPQHHYLVRTIDPVGPDLGFANARFVEARGPFETDNERRLMEDHAIDVLVTKNSGGQAAAAKLAAARHLGLPVILVRRPAVVDRPSFSVEDALAAIGVHSASVQRGV